MTRESDARNARLKFGSCAHQVYGGCASCKGAIKMAAEADALEAQLAETQAKLDEKIEQADLDPETLMPRSVSLKDRDTGKFSRAVRMTNEDSGFVYYEVPKPPRGPLTPQQVFDRMVRRQLNG
jgi:hypothetical protein